VASFLRIDGEDSPLHAGRLTWYPAVSERERGLAVHLAAHGPRSLLHVAVFVPGMSPSDLSSREATIVEAGPDAAVDGRMFGALLLRFGRVDGERAVLSLDGEVEGIESGSEARSVVAADIVCTVEAGEVPTYCQRCGAELAGESRSVGRMIGGRHVELHRPLPICHACAAEPGLVPPVRCSQCGETYQAGQVEWQSDELALAYTSTCVNGHTVSGLSVRPAPSAE
jgi:hypothetical protein